MKTVEPIVSLQNPQVKGWAALSTKKGRDRAGRFMVEGAHLVSEAVRSGADIDSIIYVPGSLAEAEVRGLDGNIERVKAMTWVPVSEAVMAKITDTVTPQGIAAVVRMQSIDPNELFRENGGSYIVVDAVQDPGNLGTVIRSADASGFDGVFLGAGTVDLYNPKTVRATMGSIFHLPIVGCNLDQVLPLMQSRRVRVVATSLEASRTCYESDLSGSVCFIVGNEGAGVSDQWIRMADETVIIPMAGKAESLNVAAAATVLMFEALRQRNFAK